MIDAKFISDSLGGKRSGRNFIACCPAHDDTNPSLSIKDGDDGEPVFKCFAGCTKDDVVKLLQNRGLWPSHDPKLSQKDLKALQDEVKFKKAVREKKRIEKQAKAACKAKDILNVATGDTTQHPYALKKGVPLGHFVKRGSWPQRGWDDALLIPLYDSQRKVTTISAIHADGTKDLLANGKMKGSFCPVGTIKGAVKIIVGEGLATVASACSSTGLPGVVAVNAGNLKTVAEVIRHLVPATEIIIIADDDQKPDGSNPGKSAAMAAAKAVSGKVAIPELGKKADAWDVWNEQGPDTLKKMIEAASVPTSDAAISQLAHSPATDWPEPLPLPDGLPPVKKLDHAMIPAPFRDWLTDIAHRMQSPVDFSTAAAIVALGSIIGRGCGIYPKQHDNWLVVPNLWGGVIGLPSVLKTPNISEGMRHVNRLEGESKRQYEEETAKYNTEIVVVDIQKKAICENIKKAVKNDPSSDVSGLRDELEKFNCYEPTRRRYQTQDGTPPKIGEILKENPRGILINRDELIGWFRNLDKAGNEADRSFHLEAWNGTCRYTYDRIGRGTIDVEALCESIFGAVTPGPLADYIRKAVKGGQGADGLIQRFQVMVWPDTATEWENIDRYPDTSAKNRAYEIFKVLSGDIPGAVQEDDESIPALRFSPAGQQVFDEWRHELETRLIGDHSLHPAMVSHLAKYRSLMPSLALIFHLVEVADETTPPGPVSDRATIMAAAWCDYLESHAARVYGAANSLGLEPAREIIKHIQKGEIKTGCKPKDIYRHQWSRLATPEDVKRGIEVLAEEDWLILEKVSTGGRPSEIINLNPNINFL